MFPNDRIGNMNKKRNSLIICLLIFLCFGWMGSAYFTWYYKLLGLNMPGEMADLVLDVIGYVIQAAGVLAGYFLCRFLKPVLFHKYVFAFASILCFVFAALSVIPRSFVVVMIFGLISNLFYGIIFYMYLYRLARDIPDDRRAIIFGIGYASGSIFTWLISLINDGAFISSSYILIVYAVMTALSVYVYYLPVSSEFSPSPSRNTPAPSRNILILSGLTVLFLSLSSNLGGSFQTGDLTELGNIVEFSRSFYSIGLIVAALICDKSRKAATICCLASLFAPFALLIFRFVKGANIGIWIAGYILLAFFVVFRCIMFTDLARMSPALLPLAGLGMFFGRLGDALGTYITMNTGVNIELQIVITSIVFALTIAVSLLFWHKTYMQPQTESMSFEYILEEFSSSYNLSSREVGVLKLLLERKSNGEIASELNISESTVKFHVKNILRKTGCSNRNDLISTFYS